MEFCFLLSEALFSNYSRKYFGRRVESKRDEDMKTYKDRTVLFLIPFQANIVASN